MDHAEIRMCQNIIPAEGNNLLNRGSILQVDVLQRAALVVTMQMRVAQSRQDQPALHAAAPASAAGRDTLPALAWAPAALVLQDLQAESPAIQQEEV